MANIFFCNTWIFETITQIEAIDKLLLRSVYISVLIPRLYPLI
jgi:hypothetical protein